MNKIDQAWEEKRYDEVLLLLQQDSLYPDNFNYEDLNNCEAGKPLKGFVDEMTKLHEHVSNGNLLGVKEITSHYKSESYLNLENQSAALTALQSKKFNIYAYLKSIGVVLGKVEKEFIDDKLQEIEKQALREKVRSYFPEDHESLILYLTLKSKSINPPEDFRRKMAEYYKKLYAKIPEILKVVGYENNLEVIFDHKDVNAVGIYGEYCYAVTLPEEKTIYLGSLREEDEILGTLAHELTHLAMEMVFKNECKPYEATDVKGAKKFGKITERIKKDWQTFEGAEVEIIAAAFERYQPPKYHSELIVRASQILTRFQNGEEWLQHNTPDFLTFYKKKVIKKCQDFVSLSYLIKPRSNIKTLNEKGGEIISLIKSGLYFENLKPLKDFLSSKIISFIITRNTRLGLLRVLQALLGKMYVNYYDNFIVFKFQDCVTFLTDIKTAFDSEATHFLLLDCASVNNSSLKKGIEEITLMLGADKKIIFVVEELQSEIIKELSESKPCWGSMPDENFYLSDLDLDSQKKILKKEILIQGRKTDLRNLLGQNKELHNIITSDVIGHLFSDGKVEIGNKIFGISNLEGSYAQIFQEIDIASLKREMDKSDSIFVFMGDREKLKEISLTTEAEAPVDLKNSGAINKKILWTQSLEDDFKQFCQNNQLKKIYLINISGDEFVLQQIYNPDFYMTRKVRKIAMDVNKLEHAIKTCRKETFIFTGGGTSIEDWVKKYPNVKKLDESQDHEWMADGNGSQDSEDGIHWFQEENGALIWKNSRGNIGKVLRASSEELSSNHLTEENEVAEDIAERKIMIISDEPGMGKSTTITKLYHYEIIAEKHWIIRINLKDCLKAIRNLPTKNFTIRNLITFLQGVESNLNNSLTIFFLDLVLDPQKRILKDLLLVFDGFDELLDQEDRNKTIGLLKFLKNETETKSKVWIASRLHYKEFLEMELNTFALRFDPLGDKRKKEFIKKYYGDRLNLILSSEQFSEAFNGGHLEIYGKNFITKIESIFQENLSTILGTPLQLNLLLDGSMEYFLSWFKNRSNVDFSYLGNNLFQVYENFIDRKYGIFFKKKQIEEDLIRELVKASLEPYHKHLARNSLHKTSLEDFEKYKPLILLIGLAQMQNENLQFFHFTFREFYSAKIIVEFLADDGIKENNFTEAARKYLVQVFTEPEYKLIRRFIDCQLQETGNFTFSKIGPNISHLIDVTYCHIEMDIVSDGKYPIMKHSEELGNLLYINISESNNSIFNLLFSCLKPFFESTFDLMMLTTKSGHHLPSKIYHPPSLLHCAIVTGNLSVFDSLLEAMEELPTHQQKHIIQIIDSKRDNILQVAEDNGRIEILMKLVQKIKSIFSRKQQEMLRCKFKNKQLLIYPIRTINFKILNFVLKYAEEVLRPKERKLFFTKKLNSGENVLFLAVRSGDPKLLQILITESGKILSKDLSQFFMSLSSNSIEGNLLFHAVFQNSSQMTKEVLRQSKEILNPQERKDFFLAEKSTNYNVLHAAFIANNFEIIEILLKEAQIFLSVDERINLLVGKTGGIDDVLISALSRKQIELVEYLLTLAEELLVEKKQKKPSTSGIAKTRMTLLLMAAIKIKAEIIDLLKGSEEREKCFFRLADVFQEADPGSSNSLKLITEMLLKEVKNVITNDNKQLKFFTLGKEAVENVIILGIHQNNVEIVELLLHNEKKIIVEEELKKLFGIISKTGLQLDRGKKTVGRNIKTGNIDRKLEIAKALLMNFKEILSPQEMPVMFINEMEGNILHYSTLNNKVEITRNILRKSKELLSAKEKKLFFLSKMTTEIGLRNSLFVACRKNHFEIIEMLLNEAENFVSANERMELFFEKEKKKRENIFASFFLKKEENFESNVLIFAVQQNNVKLTEILLNGIQKLLLSEEQKELLLTKSKETGENVLEIATRQGNKTQLEYLLSKFNIILSIQE